MYLLETWNVDLCNYPQKLPTATGKHSTPVVYRLFGQVAARLCDSFAREQVFPLELDCVYHLPSGVFAQAGLSFVPVTTGSVTLLLTVLNLVTLLRKVGDPVSGFLCKLQAAWSPMEAPAGFDLLTLNVERTVKTKVVALRRLLQWSGYPAVLLLQEGGALPPRFMFHCLYWHTFTVVSSSPAGVALLVHPDLQLCIGDFTQHPDDRANVLELTYQDTFIQVVNASVSAKGTAKEKRPLLQWLRAHLAPDSRLVLLGGDFQCNRGWLVRYVSVHTEIAPVLLEFAVDMHLHPFTDGMRGPTWVSAQGFVGALDFFLSCHASSDIGVVRVESESVFPLDHYPLRLRLFTLPAELHCACRPM